MMHDLYKVSAILFYALGAMAFLAHIVGFMKNWMKIKEMRQKAKAKAPKVRSPVEDIKRRLRKAEERARHRPRKLRD